MICFKLFINIFSIDPAIVFMLIDFPFDFILRLSSSRYESELWIQLTFPPVTFHYVRLVQFCVGQFLIIIGDVWLNKRFIEGIGDLLEIRELS